MNGTALRLVTMCLVTGLLLSGTHALTRDRIDANRQAFAARQLLEIAARDDVSIVQVAPQRYAITSDAGLTGYIFEVTTLAGYNGRIDLWLGVDLRGQVTGVRVKYHQETPGLGDGIDLAVSDWVLGFNGYRLDNNRAAFEVKRAGGDFDQFSGATITPRAVIHAVRDGLAQFDLEKAAWLEEVSPDEL